MWNVVDWVCLNDIIINEYVREELEFEQRTIE